MWKTRAAGECFLHFSRCKHCQWLFSLSDYLIQPAIKSHWLQSCQKVDSLFFCIKFQDIGQQVPVCSVTTVSLAEIKMGLLIYNQLPSLIKTKENCCHFFVFQNFFAERRNALATKNLLFCNQKLVLSHQLAALGKF